MFSYLLLAVLIVALIILVYYIFYSDQRKRRAAKELLNKSAGTFDTHARAALHTIDAIRNPTPVDHFQRGRIHRYNMRDHRGDNVARFGDHAARYNVPLATAIREYTLALEGMGANGGGANGGGANDRGAGQLHEETAEFILDDVNALYDEIILWELFNPEAMEVVHLRDAIGAQTQYIRANSAAERVRQAASTSTTKAETIGKALDDAGKMVSDGQNVHDSKVNGDLRELVKIFKRSTDMSPAEVQACITDIRAFVNESRDPDIRRKRTDITTAINKMSEGAVNGTIGITEAEALACVWKRCEHRGNNGEEWLMKEAVVASLADCVENGHLVCVNGRCARVLNSLVTLDFDPNVAKGGVVSMQAYRHEIFSGLKDVINYAITDGTNSDDPEIKKEAEAYDTAGNADGEKFKEVLKKSIDTFLGKYTSKLTPDEFSAIKDECHAYALM